MSSARSRPARHSPSLPWLVTVLAAAVLAGACGSASTSVVAPTTEKCQISVTGFTGAFGAAGGSGSATVDTARECSWSAAVQAGWIALSPPTSGTGAGKVTFSVAANTTPRARSGTLSVNDQPLTVSQDAAPCRFTVTPISFGLGATGGGGSVTVGASDDTCAWNAASQADWVVVSGPAARSGSGAVAFTVAANPGVARNTSLSIAGQSVTVTQAAALACEFTVSPSAVTFPSTGGQASVRVATAAGCGWQAGSEAAWLRVSPASGTASDTVVVTADANAATAPRSAPVTVAGTTVTVTQAGALAGTPVSLSGPVEGRRGGCPGISFTVQNTSVVTTADTVFAGGSCDRLRNGDLVVVEGVQSGGQPVVATRVTTTGG